ncbi:site-2 protease family protein [Rugamonas apoptosis]|uniref:Site-2 protease family protein n=1 Tax=Rugamonas apoptosis TaxID=2758570 RepID=A0A7W2F7A1_9BURK|nr:site-2 protease family protein [Rugamonas apoptosis]MBA5686294.1 site-2 protease family protein [Rugamonas apoptosis]
MNDYQTILVYALPVLFAITLHEAAHAYAARYFGDSTAYLAGRMSMNPIKHIDLLGTIIIPIMLYLATDGKFVFGYAKPVPVDFSALRNPKKQMAWVALAGPAANFVMAFGWMMLALLESAAGVTEPFFVRMAQAGILTNILMFAFNLVPIPPLDGGRILTSALPHALAYKFARIEPYGFYIVLALIYFKILNFFVVPLAMLTEYALRMLLTPLSLLLS